MTMFNINAFTNSGLVSMAFSRCLADAHAAADVAPLLHLVRALRLLDAQECACGVPAALAEPNKRMQAVLARIENELAALDERLGQLSETTVAATLAGINAMLLAAYRESIAEVAPSIAAVSTLSERQVRDAFAGTKPVD